MRFGNWRGVTLALGMAMSVLTSANVFAGGFHLINNQTVDAVDVNTGGPYYAPPIPYGHYAKDPIGQVGMKVGGMTHSIFGKLHGLKSGAKCGACGGAGTGCGACGGTGFLGHGDGGGCGACGGLTTGAGFGHHGLFGHKAEGCGVCGIGHSSTIVSSAQGGPTPQGPVVSPQGFGEGYCGDMNCGTPGTHKHGLFSGGHGIGKGGCGACGGAGCGSCGGGFGGHGLGTGCKACGGKGCGLCSKAKGLASGLIGKILHKDKIKWFVGPGGPVPLTPGYVPYVVSTRSPRDFLSFFPMNPDAD